MSSPIAVAGPSGSPEDIALVGRLWRRLHAHHQAVSPYRGLVEDLDVSWDRRRRWYLDLMQQGGALWFARDQDGEPIAYTFATLAVGSDDTFESTGTVELVSLIVDESFRGSGIGQALIQAVEREARSRGIDLFKVAVMAGNDTALRFYQLNGFELVEQVLYRPIT